MSLFAKSRVTAVLGPTNTGKTYLAIDRMLGHSSGMIGFPLRLLARENYDRIVRRSEEHTSELQSLMRISYAVFCLKNKNEKTHIKQQKTQETIIILTIHI